MQSNLKTYFLCQLFIQPVKLQNLNFKLTPLLNFFFQKFL